MGLSWRTEGDMVAETGVLARALSGWRLMARHPNRLIGWWAMLFAVTMALTALPYLVMAMIAPSLDASIIETGADPRLRAASVALINAGVSVLLTPMLLAAYAVVFVAAARTTFGLDGPTNGPGRGWRLGLGMRLGWAEWRLTLAMIVLMLALVLGWALLLVGYSAVMFAVGPVLVDRAVMVRAFVNGPAALALAYLCVRFALAPTQAAEAGRAGLGQSWRATRRAEVFWVLSLAVMMAAAVYWGGKAIVWGASFAFSGGAPVPAVGAQLWLRQAMAPIRLVAAAMSSLGVTMAAFIVITPACAAWRRSNDPAAVFS
jgi:hypothetical protein